jgi:hypothetical protein
MYVLLLNKILRIAHEIKHKKHIHTYSKFIQKNISRKIEKTYILHNIKISFVDMISQKMISTGFL